MDLITPILAAAASFTGAWLAARFALLRFYKERVWERKTEAYSNIFALLHDMSKWSTTHIEANMKDREISQDDQQKLRAEWRESKAKLQRQLAREAWLLPEAFHERIRHLFGELSKSNHQSFDDLLFHDDEAIAKAEVDLQALVRDDLGLNRSFLWRRRAVPDE